MCSGAALSIRWCSFYQGETFEPSASEDSVTVDKNCKVLHHGDLIFLCVCVIKYDQFILLIQRDSNFD